MTRANHTIGVITPYLSGFVLGEISGHLRFLAKEKNLNIIMIRANGYAHYQQPLALDHIDALLVILNSASYKLIEQALALNIPIVSTAGDYRDFNVEQVSSDQIQGIRDAFDHFIALGHRNIGFAGDLSNIDIFSRFVAYKDRLTHWQLPYNEAWTLDVNELNLAGGREAGRLYLQRPRECTAMICSTDLIAIGMIEQIKKSGIRVPEDLAILGVDNTVLGATQKPALTSIDQDLKRLTHTAVNRLIERIHGANYQPQPFTLPQTLMIRESCGAPLAMRQTDPCSASVKSRLEHEFSANQIDSNESVMAFAKSGLDSILNLSSLYGPFLQWGCFARCKRNRPDTLYIQDFFSETSEDKQLSQEDLLRCPTRKFPPEQLFSHSFPDNYFITLVPIHSENNCPWGVVAIIDKVEHCVQVSYGIFNNYLDLMSLFIERDALIESIKQREQKATDLAKQLEVVASTSNDGIWDWDLGNNEINWNNRLLEMLGFKQSQEKHAYRHMNLFDRIHPDDDQEIRNQVSAHIKKNTPFKATFRLLSNHNEYLWVEASGKALRTPQGRATRFIGSMTDITQQRLHQQRIRHMAYHDTLTGLPNRAMLDEFLKDHIRHRGLNPLSVMLMDLDRFKLINDSYGHDVGDALLRHVAKTLQPLLRSSDFFARFGGDEFVFVSPLAEESQAIELAQRLLDGVETPFKYKGIDLSSQGSIGIAFYPTDGTSADDLIKKADIAMYRAKRIEKSSATLYHSAMNSDIQQQASLEQQLKLALAQAQFDVHFQPQINPLGGRLLGIEALARWNNPVLGQVSPERFIAAAESMGLISELGKQVGIKAMQTLARWNRDYPQMTLQLSINVSPGQLMRPNFSDEFLSWIETTQCPANKITVEVTESTTLNDLEHSRTMLLRLAEQGVVISLDDFGTGYSSLALLKQLPLSWIKIDRSFVRDLETDKSNQDIIKSIVMLCHSFGFQTVAEGVETEEQLQIISDIGCDWVQGFIYSPALSANEFEQKYLKTTQAQDKEKPDNYPAH